MAEKTRVTRQTKQTKSTRQTILALFPKDQDQHLASTACQTVSKSVSFKDERILRECRMGIADLLRS